jgi:DNA-directed RNA polymerase specialized sigma24 family protein
MTKSKRKRIRGSQDKAREKETSRLREKDGWTYDEIGFEFDISRQRAHQIYQRARAS